MKALKPKGDFATALANIPKFVKKEVASRPGRGAEFEIDYDLMAITEQKGHEILAVVNPKYNLIQFSQIYTPAVNKYDDFEFSIDYFKGKSSLHVLPINDDNKENEDKIGIVVDNSVDCSRAICIGFEVYTKSGLRFPIHTKFRKVHSADALTASTNYLQIVQKTRQLWKEITENMMKSAATKLDYDNVVKALHLGTKKAEKLWNTTLGIEAKLTTVWQLVEAAVILLDKRNYKTEWHRTRRFNDLADLIQQYAFIYKLAF